VRGARCESNRLSEATRIFYADVRRLRDEEIRSSKKIEDDYENEDEDERRCRGVAGEGLVREAKAGC